MGSKTILLLLGVILLCQGFNAAPHYRNKDAAIDALKERLMLTKLVSTEIMEFSHHVLENGKTIIEKLLKDPEILSIESETIKLKLTPMHAYIKHFDEIEKNDVKYKKRVQDLMELFDEIETAYKETDDKPLETVEDKIIGKFLKENNFTKFGEIAQDFAKTSTDKVYTEIETYYNNLDEAGKKDETELKDFIKAYKAETDIKKRGDLLMKLVEGFELDKFLW